MQLDNQQIHEKVTGIAEAFVKKAFDDAKTYKTKAPTPEEQKLIRDLGALVSNVLQNINDLALATVNIDSTTAHRS